MLAGICGDGRMGIENLYKKSGVLLNASIKKNN
jgi:hypothetical protein